MGDFYQQKKKKSRTTRYEREVEESKLEGIKFKICDYLGIESEDRLEFKRGIKVRIQICELLIHTQ